MMNINQNVVYSGPTVQCQASPFPLTQISTSKGFPEVKLAMEAPLGLRNSGNKSRCNLTDEDAKKGYWET